MQGSYKKVKDYLIAMDEQNLLGRGRIGDVRRGFQEQHKLLLVFKIASLPLPNKMEEALKLQQKVNDKDIMQAIYPVAFSTSKYYVPYEFLPWSLQDLKYNYVGNQPMTKKLLQQIVQCYSYLYFLGIGHNNLKNNNILFTSQKKIRLADPFPSADFDATTTGDLVQLGMIIYQVLTGKPYRQPFESDSKFTSLIQTMIDGNISWTQLFQELSIDNKWTRLFNPSPYNTYNRIYCLNTLNIGKTEEEAYVKLSITKTMLIILRQQLRQKHTNSQYRKLLEKQENQLSQYVAKLPNFRLVGLRDVLWNPSRFSSDLKSILTVLMCLIHVDILYFVELLPSLTDAQCQVMYSSYCRRLDLRPLMCIIQK